MASKPIPSPEVLRQLLRYEPETGKLFWEPRGPQWFEHLDRPEVESRIWIARNAGREAFTASDGKGYLQGQVLKYHTMAHRVIWAMHSGEWAELIDHINGNGCDNRIANLRAVSRKENGKNAAIPVTNSSGIMGVRFHKGGWEAHITVGGRQQHVGRYCTMADAAAARKAAQSAHGYHPNHGRPASSFRKLKRGASLG